MKPRLRTGIMLSGLSVLALLHAAPSSADPYQLVGFTLNQPLGDQGVWHYNQLCRNAFVDPGVRMCSALEIVETVVVPNGLTGDAWVLPSDGLTAWLGTPVPQETCVGWTQTVSNGVPVDGLRVDSAGRFSLGACNTSASVACCAPLPIP